MWRVVVSWLYLLWLPSLALGATYYVAPDGTGDFPTILAAVTAAAHGDTILLLDGVFTGPGNRAISGYGKAIVVASQSGNPETCRIDCEHADPAFVFWQGEPRDFVLEGIALSNGAAANQQGGAVSCTENSSPTIRNCIFEDNWSSWEGGAVWCHQSSPLVTDCDFSRNRSIAAAGGAIACCSADPEIERCTFVENSAYSGGAVDCNYSSSPALNECTFKANEARMSYGGGVMCRRESAPVITDCVFRYNTSADCGGALFSYMSAHPAISHCLVEENTTGEWGGGFEFWGEATVSDCHFRGNFAGEAAGGMGFCHGLDYPTVEGCTFEGNSSPWGGAMCIYDEHPSIVGCTFYANSATIEAGGIYVYGSSTTLMERTIVSFSTQGEAIVVWESSPSQMTLTCCDLYGNAGGDWIGAVAGQYGVNGNICEDPLFCDAGSSDFTLQAISPCAPFSPPNPECDLIGAWPVGCGYQDIDVLSQNAPELVFARITPNPAANHATFSFGVGSALPTLVTLGIHDATGRLIRRLARKVQGTAEGTIEWDGRDRDGRRVPPGIYFCSLACGGHRTSRTLAVVP